LRVAMRAVGEVADGDEDEGEVRRAGGLPSSSLRQQAELAHYLHLIPVHPAADEQVTAVTHQPIRATASPWLVWRCSICGARSRRNGERLNP
jgi:hypothetical protein